MGRVALLVAALIAGGALLLATRRGPAASDAPPRSSEPTEQAAPSGLATRAAWPVESGPASAQEAAAEAPDPEASAPWVVAGRVTDRDGRGIEGAEVCFGVYRGPRPPTDTIVRTDAQGGYRARVAAPAAMPPLQRFTAGLSAFARAPGYLRGDARRAVGTLARLPPVIEWDWALERGHVLRGRVVEADGRCPEGVSVRLHACATDEDAAPAPCDEDGSFELRIPGAGDFTLRAEAMHRFLAEAARPIRLDPDEDAEAPPLILPAGESIAGVLRWADGRPAAGATLWAEWRGSADRVPATEGGREEAMTVVGPEGCFRFDGLEPGRFALRGEEGMVPDGPPLAMAETGETRLVLVTRAGAARFRVRDASGQPVPWGSFSHSRQGRGGFA